MDSGGEAATEGVVVVEVLQLGERGGEQGAGGGRPWRGSARRQQVAMAGGGSPVGRGRWQRRRSGVAAMLDGDLHPTSHAGDGAEK